MKRAGRGLSADEAALWARLAKTVTPLEGKKAPPPPGEVAARSADGGGAATSKPLRTPGPPPSGAARLPPPRRGEDHKVAPRPLDRHGLDASWDRKLARGLIQPDFTLDLHGSSLDAAHGRLEHGLTLALAQQARLVLLITGRHRPSDDRRSRGVIRRKFMDWIAAGPHASRIAAVRPAHQRHGGAGAVYIVLRKPR